MSCTPSRPGDRVANIILVDSQFFQFGPYCIGLMQTNRGQHDFSVLNCNVVVVSLTDYLDDGLGQGDLVLARPLGQHGIFQKQ